MSMCMYVIPDTRSVLIVYMWYLGFVNIVIVEMLIVFVTFDTASCYYVPGTSYVLIG